MTLDDGDNDPVVLLTHLAAALDLVSTVDPDLPELLATPDISVEATLVPRFATSIAAIPKAFVLVLDEVQELSHAGCADAIDALIESLPPGSQLVLSGRFQPSRRMASLRARGLVSEFGPSSLRMGESEAAELFSAAELSMDEPRITELVDRTEGWPAGLHLVALSIRGGAPIKIGDGAAGDGPSTVGYLQEQMLSSLAPEPLARLARMSILEELSAPLCDAVFGSSDCAEVLDGLNRDDRLLMPLDQNRQWFRFNKLFRELLRAELERTEPGLAPDLFRRASDWSLGNGYPDAAMSYAQAAMDPDRVVNLVLTRGQQEYRRGRAVTVERWLDWLEEHGDLELRPVVAALGAS